MTAEKTTNPARVGCLSRLCRLRIVGTGGRNNREGKGPNTLSRTGIPAEAVFVVDRFEKAFQGLRTTGASVSAHEVVEALNRHGREEAELLERYQRFIEEAESPAAQYLVQLILDDEQRHHRVLGELANTIAWGWMKGAPEEVVPVFPKDGDDWALRAETRALLGHELRDRAELRRLRRRLHSYGDAPPWGLLVDLMRSDTKKHIDILRYILRITSRRRLPHSYFLRLAHRRNY
jgi:hypothetical protein